MPEDWSWTPDETGLDDDRALDPLVAREFGLWEVDDDSPCPYCGETDCERSCTGAILAQQQAAFATVQARAERLYAAYLAGLGPLAQALPAWQDLIDRQQYAWRCVARAQAETDQAQEDVP